LYSTVHTPDAAQSALTKRHTSKCTTEQEFHIRPDVKTF